MKVFLTAAYFACAQYMQMDPPPSPPEQGQEQASPDVGGMAQPDAGPQMGGEPAPKEEVGTSASVDDARENFATIVETFLAQNTKEGVWNLRDKRTKKIRRLTLDAIQPKTVKEASKSGHFRGNVRFKDQNGKTVIMEMSVDMSGAQWRVAGARMLKGQK